MSNKSAGTGFERDFADLLFENGFWVHLLQQNKDGQPADVIAARNGKTYLIDCKDCENDEFPLARVEENQRLAMTMWKGCGNGGGWFALKAKEQIYMIPHFTMEAFCHSQSKLSFAEICECGKPIERWMARCK